MHVYECWTERYPALYPEHSCSKTSYQVCHAQWAPVNSKAARRLLPWELVVAVFGIPVLLLTGCRPPLPSARVVCPEPEPPRCSARPWDGHPKDTTLRTDRPYWSISVVQGLSEPQRDELALRGFPDGSAWVTMSTQRRQWVATARLLQLARAQLEAEWQAEFTAYGTPTGTPKYLIVAARPNPPDSADIRLFAGSLRGSRLVVDSALRWPPSGITWESQPALSPNGMVLFFAADYPEGYGGTDLYFAVKAPDGSWQGPYNCGPYVNSACNELTPSVSADGRWLLFASNGHSSIGGYDIFAASISPEFWRWVERGMPTLPSDTRLLQPWFSEALNLGTPVNSPADELSPAAPGTPDSLLYWSSNRAGSFDVYVLQRHEPLATPLSPAEVRKVELRGQVRERETQRPIARAEVRAYRVGEPEPIAQTTTDTTGLYRLQVPAQTEIELVAQAGEVFFEARRIATGTRDTVLPPLEPPVRLFLRLNFPFDRYDAPYPFVLDSLGNETSMTWQRAIDLLAEHLLQYRHQIRYILLVGHTDDIGSAEYNRWLGQRRVEFVVRELLRRGVPEELLQWESAGQSQLLPRLPNEAVELWRKRCRRVELTKVLQNPR